jgi:hypothetical protein
MSVLELTVAFDTTAGFIAFMSLTEHNESFHEDG